MESGTAQRIAVRRAELHELEGQLTKHLEEMRAEDQIGLLEASGRALAGRRRVSPTALPRSSRRMRR